MTQKVYGVLRDNGDGSCSIEWHRDKSYVDFLLDEEQSHVDDYWPNEGVPAEELVFPDNINLEECGFRFRT